MSKRTDASVRPGWRQRAGARAREMLRNLRALRFALRDPRTPRLARWIAAAALTYALSPIDLIPDFIPVAGHLDDLLLVPLGIALAIRLIPAEVWSECKAKAARPGN